MTGFTRQPARRPVPGYVNVLGEATNTASVSVNTNLAYRKGRYFWAELSVDNTANPIWLGITNLAVMPVGGGNYVVSNVTGRVFVPKTPESFGYDADGNLTQDGRWSYTWNAENRLVKVESRTTTPLASWRRVEWQYDALGRRIRQTTSDGSSGTWQVTEDLKFVSDPVLFGRHTAELNATNNALVRSYVWGLDLSGSLDGAGGVGGLLLFQTYSNSYLLTSSFCAYDGNGNVAALVNAADGTETARYEYGPFGEPLRLTGPMARENPFRFSTKRTDNTTDLILYEYRAYSPTLGRWPNRDPLGEQGGMNLYCGLHNDPNNYIDALDLKQCVGAGVQTFGFGGQGNIGPIGYLIAGRGSFAYQRCSTCCGKQDDIVDINASFQATFTGSSGFAQVVLDVDWGAMVRYGILVRGGVEATAGARFESDRCNGKGLTGKMCLSGKGSLGIGGGAVATVTVAGLVQQLGADLMGNGYATITRCYECNNDHCEWGKIKICGGADVTATFYVFLARTSFTIWKGDGCFEF